MTDQLILKFFADYVQSQLGIIYQEANYFQLEHRLKDIAYQLGLKDINELFQKAKNEGFQGALKNLLLDLATNNETSFFRDAAIFRALSKYIIPQVILDGTFKSSLNIWSAACSAGQEVYSIAMEYEEAQKANPTWPRHDILATDVSDTILKRAESGIYSQLEVQRGLPARMLIQYFDKEGDASWRVKPSLQRHIHFKKLNLLDKWSHLGPFDIIFCRNVLIYQSVENKKNVIDRMHELLNPRGFLVLGAAESLFGISQDFDQVSEESAVFYRKKRA